MALPFKRNFENGRQSEQFLNDELITLYEVLKYLPHHKQDHDGEMPPGGKLPGAMNAQIPAGPTEDSSLNYWNGSEWVPFFKKKFQITDQILYVRPVNPVTGQLWLNNGALFYFDGQTWCPVKTVEVNDSQWSTGAFADFELVSPLNPIGQYVVPVGSGNTYVTEYIYNYAGSCNVTNRDEKNYATDRIYCAGQSELTVHLNGILLICGRDYDEYTSNEVAATERGQICSMVHLRVDLQENDVISYNIARKMPVTNVSSLMSHEQHINEDYHQYFYQDQLDYIADNTVVGNGETWDFDWNSPELDEPQEIILGDDYESQFPIPNLATDRVFVDNKYDESYIGESSICFKYKTRDVIHKTVSAIHVNPGKITGIRKRLIKVDKTNSTIAVSPYNTEFYGFRRGESGGSFLIPSKSQDYGDYVTAGDHIILNYYSNQNYDFILAITYEFAWMRADGVMARNKLAELSNGFYLTNLRTPVNIHVDGMKLEEASYDVNTDTQTVIIDDDASNVHIALWSPYKKQFGYIRETDIRQRGVIKLREPVHVPLVFVGGTLIHPVTGGLEFSEDGRYIYVPTYGFPSIDENGTPVTIPINQMRNMQWCVIDLISDDYEEQIRQWGTVSETMGSYIASDNDQLIDNEMHYEGDINNTPDENGIYEYILGSGRIVEASEAVIHYDPEMIRPEDSILLFIDGLLVPQDQIDRDPEKGIIVVRDGLVEGQEYVLLKDIDGAIYNSTTMIPSFSTGYFSDSLVYMNGQLLCNTNCITTLNTPEQELREGIVDNEVRYFITNDITGEGYWAIYNQYSYAWRTLEEDDPDLDDILLIVNGYENMLTSVRLNVPHTDQDDITIFTFKFANDLTGLTEVGQATFLKLDEEDDVPIFTIGTPHYGYNIGQLNVFRNGVKLVRGRDYEETSQGKWFRMLADYEEDDIIQYIIEPIERGYSYGHKTVTMTKEDAVNTNIYKIDDTNQMTLYPGRLTVYVNGIRIPNTDWALVTPKTIMLRYTNYKAVGSTHNFPDEEFVGEDYAPILVHHELPDSITVELRQDYDRKEKTIYLSRDMNELYIEDAELDASILETTDEVLFYLNGQFTGLSRNKNSSYRLDRYKGCIAFFDPEFIEASTKDGLKSLFDQNNYIYTAWKKMTGKTEYEPGRRNALTIVWR